MGVDHHNIGIVAGAQIASVLYAVELGRGMAHLLDNPFERELAPFASIRDAYPRYLITADTFGTGRNFDGVVQVNAAQWLEQTNLKKSASPVQ